MGGSQTTEGSVPATPSVAPSYDAFISYSRRDIAFARALERTLSRYRPPRDLAVPQRPLRIFRDEQDFTGSDYVIAIRRHLTAANRLIVVCSPAARASRYVNEEIGLFGSARGSDAIVPLLIEGLANNEAAPEREAEQAFPDALVSALSMPLAVDYRGYDPQHPRIDRGGFEGPWHKLLADLYGLPRDQIEQREKTRRARTRRNWAIGTSTVMAILVGLAIWALIARDEAIRQREIATTNESHALTALSSVALESGNSHDALKLAIAAWPRDKADSRPKLGTTLDALSAAMLAPQQLAPEISNALDVSADGTRAVSLAADGTMQLWDVTGGLPVAGPLTHDGVRFGRFSRDGQRLVTRSRDGSVVLWDTTSGHSLGGGPLKHKNVGEFAFSADGRRLVTSGSNVATVWDAVTGAPIGEPLEHQGVSQVWISANGERLLTRSGNQTVLLWDIKSATPMGGALERSGALLFWLSGDSNRFVTRSSGTTSLWSAADGKRLNDLDHPGVKGSRFSEDGKFLVTWAADGTVRFWDPANGAPVGNSLKHDGVDDVLFVSDRNLLISMGGHAVHLWDPATRAPIGGALEHPSVRHVSISRDRKHLATVGGNEVRLWDRGAGAQTGKPLKHPNVWRSSFSSDGKLLATWSWDGTARIWDATNGATFGDPLTHDKVFDAVLSRDGKRLATIGGNVVRLWDPVNGTPIGQALQHGGVPNASFSDDGARLATMAGNTLHLWDASNGLPIGTPLTHDGGVLRMAFSGDSSVLATAARNAVRLWDAKSGTPIGGVLRHDGLQWLALSRDGKRVATAGQDAVLAWQRNNDTAASQRREHPGVRHVAISADGKRMATSGGDIVRLWDAEQAGAPTSELKHAAVYGAVFSADGSLLATWSTENGTVRLWNASSGAPVGQTLHHEGAHGALFSQDGRRLATISNFTDAQSYLWDLSSYRRISDSLSNRAIVSKVPLGGVEAQSLVDVQVEQPYVLRALWSNPPGDHLLSAACRRLLGHAREARSLEKKYGITIGNPLCESMPPAPDRPTD
jgi:WD40 repeat protein